MYPTLAHRLKFTAVLCRALFFFFSSRRRHTRFDCDWSSDVCSSDLPHTAHTTNPVPFLMVGDGANVPLRHGSALCDVGPTVLRMLDIEPPPEMTGRDLRETD